MSVVASFKNFRRQPQKLAVVIEQFEDQTTTRVLIAALEEYEDLGTIQKEDVKKTPAKMLPSTYCMCRLLYAFLL